MIAAHAAAPVCPRCARAVRSGVALQAAVADLADLLHRLAPLGTSDDADDRDLFQSLRCLLARYACELHAELKGSHLHCGATALDEDLLAIALSRASRGAARERSDAH